MGLEAVARDQYLYRRQGRYYVRRRVPKDLVRQVGKDQIVKSLFTSDYRQATSLAIKAAAEIERQFDEMRGKITAAFSVSDTQLRLLDDLPLREIENIVFSWFRREAALIQGQSGSDASHEGSPAHHDAEQLDYASERFEREAGARELNSLAIRLAKGTEDVIERELTPTMAAICTAEGLACKNLLRGPIQSSAAAYVLANRQGSKYRIFRDLVRRGQIQLCRIHVADLTGQLHGIDDADFSNALKPPYRRKRGAATLAELIEEFKCDPNRRGLRKKLELDYGLLFKAMDEVIGQEKRLSEITRDDCKEVARLLERLPANATKRLPDLTLIEAAAFREADTSGKFKGLNEVTITSYLHKMSALFNFACVEERMDRNPAKGLRKNAKKHAAEDRHPFAFWQLEKIFKAPIYSGCVNDGTGWKKAGNSKPRGTKFWIPLIALFHGLRLNEACQLRIADISERDGVTFFNVRNSGEKQRVKTVSGRRVVPLHPLFDAEHLNFMAYVRRIRTEGHDRLFPDLRADSRGYYSDGFQKWFSRFLAASGARPIPDPKSGRPVSPEVKKTSFHSFRHNWRDALRDAHIPQERARVLGGWKGGSTDDNYGDGPPLSAKRRDLAKVRYEELEPVLMKLCTGAETEFTP